MLKNKYHSIDVLINNAGVAVKGDDFDTAVFDFTFQTVRIYLYRTFMEPLLSPKKSFQFFLKMEKSSLLVQWLEKCLLIDLKANS